MRIHSFKTKIVRRMTKRGELEGDEEGKKLLKRKRTRLAAWLLVRMKVMMALARRRKRGPEIHSIAQSKQLPKKLLLKRKRKGLEMSLQKRSSRA